MKPHISQTIEELRAHAALLGNMIQALEAYGQSAEVLAPTAPAQPEQHAPTPAVAARVSAAFKRRPPSAKTGRGKGVRPLVQQVAQILGGFTLAELRAYVAKHYPHMVRGIGASTYGSTLNNLAKRGVVARTATGWQWVGVGNGDLSAKEAKYREFREQITTPSNGD